MDQISPPARLLARIWRHKHPDALSAETDPLALRGQFRGEVAADHRGWMDGGVSGDVESG